MYFQAINVVRIEQQLKLRQALMEERAHKDIALQQAFAQARAAMPEAATAVATKTTSQPSSDLTLVTDGKNTYSVTWVNPSDNTQPNLTGVTLIEDDKEHGVK